MNKDASELIVLFVLMVGYAAVMNYLGGAKYLLGNNIAEAYRGLKEAIRVLRGDI